MFAVGPGQKAVHRQLNFQVCCGFQAGRTFAVQRQQEAYTVGYGEQAKSLPLRLCVVAVVQVVPQF